MSSEDPAKIVAARLKIQRNTIILLKKRSFVFLPIYGTIWLHEVIVWVHLLLVIQHWFNFRSMKLKIGRTSLQDISNRALRGASFL